jgi:hypothetical protein
LLFDLLLLYRHAAASGGSSDSDQQQQRRVLGRLLQRQVAQQVAFEDALVGVLGPQEAADPTALQALKAAFPCSPALSQALGDGGKPPSAALIAACAALAESAGGVQLPLPAEGLTRNQAMCVQFRVAKKLVLWGVVVAALQANSPRRGDSLGVAPSLETAAAASNVMSSAVGRRQVPSL